ncbi:MAG: O-antigen ligase family protein, partial [Bacteroidales bacterium]|nr:O-antigen ligase family protein [Bacteroidales bacterium]
MKAVKMGKSFFIFLIILTLFTLYQKNDSQTICFEIIENKVETLHLTPFVGEKYIQKQTIDAEIAPSDSVQTIAIDFQKQDWAGMSELAIYFDSLNNNFYIKNIIINGITKISAREIPRIIVWKRNIQVLLTCIDGLEYCVLKKEDANNSEASLTIRSYDLYQSSPIGIQLVLRLSFLPAFLVLLFIFARQAPAQRFLLFTIALFLATLPLRIDYSTWSMALMAATMIIAFIRNKARTFNWQPVFYVLCSLYAMNVAGLLYTGDWERGLARLDSTVPLVAFPVVFSMIQFSQKNVMLLLRFFVWSVMAFCTFGLLSYAAIVPELTWDMIFADSKLYAPLLTMWPAHWHPSFDSTIIMMAAPVAIYLRYRNEKQISFVEMLPGVVLPVVFTVLAGARVGMVAAPVLLGLAYVFYCKFKPVFKWGLVAVGMVVVGILLHQFPKADDRFVDPVRSDLRKTAVSAIGEKPVFGWGTGNVAKIIQSEERAHRLGFDEPVPLVQFHNQYLEDMVQFGIPGILVLLLLFGWLLWLGVRRK